MSTVQITPVYDLGVRADYLQHGTGETKKQHHDRGTNRIAPGYYNDFATIDEFIAAGNHLATKYGRKVRAHSIIQSYAPDELDVDDPSDLQRVGDVAFELAKRSFPNSPCLVVVHADSKGRNAHAHITILNHDLASEKAPIRNRTHSQIKAINDKLMVENGLRVATEYERGKEPWSVRRDKLTDDPFAVKAGDLLAVAQRDALRGPLQDPVAELKAQVAAKGGELVETQHTVKTDRRKGHAKGDIVVGWAVKAEDDPKPGYAPRMRRRKVSRLSNEMTRDSFLKAAEAELQRRAAEAQRQQQATAVQQRRDAMSAAMDAVLPKEEPLDLHTNASFDEMMAAIQARRSGEVEPSPVAAAPVEPPSVAPAPAEEAGDPEDDPSVVASAPTDPSSLATARAERSAQPERSRLWGYPARDARQRLVTDRLAAFDDYAHARLAAGLFIDGTRTADEKIGQEKLDLYGEYFFDDVREELEHREKKKYRATKLIESGIDDMIEVGKQLRAEMREGDNRLRTAKPARTVRMPSNISQPQRDRDRGLGD